jgi:tetratricopeptide (TPR) repeat protein
LSSFYEEQSDRKKQAGEEKEAKKLFELAIQYADQAAKLAPNVARYPLKLAILYDRQGQLKALRYYETAIELDPQNAEAYYRRGAFMSNYTFGSEKVLLYSPEDVMADLQRAVQLDANLSGAHYALGVAYDRMGDVEKAMAEFQKAAELDANDARSHLYLAEKYANSGQPLRAIAAFAAAIKADLENVEALKDYAFLCLAHDEERSWRQAKRALETAIQIRPNDPEILMNYGYTLFLNGENHEAISHYLRSIQLKPDWALSHYNLGVAYEAIGDKASALATYQKVMQLDPRGSQSEKAQERIRILKGEK